MAYRLGLTGALQLIDHIAELQIQSDSHLLVSQLNGVYATRNLGIRQISNEIAQKRKILLDNGIALHLKHIYRRHNKEADRLANVAMDEKASKMTFYLPKKTGNTSDRQGKHSSSDLLSTDNSKKVTHLPPPPDEER